MIAAVVCLLREVLYINKEVEGLGKTRKRHSQLQDRIADL